MMVWRKPPRSVLYVVRGPGQKINGQVVSHCVCADCLTFPLVKARVILVAKTLEDFGAAPRY